MKNTFLKHTLRLAAISACVIPVLAGSASAQALRASDASPSAFSAPVGPRMDDVAIAPRASQATAAQIDVTNSSARTDAQAYRNGLSHGQVFMIVGGATLLTGAIVGGDAGTIIMIGGAAIGIYGLYEYLQDR